MDYEIYSSNRSNLQSSAIHPIIATADKSGHFVPVGVTSAFLLTYLGKISGSRRAILNIFLKPSDVMYINQARN